MAQYALSQIVNAMYRLKKQWPDIDDESKKAAFFIINRYLSKEYPNNAHFLNKKGFDEVCAMEIWFNHQREDIKTPNWFWAKPEMKKFSKDRLAHLDQHIINKFYQKEVEEEVEYYTKMFEGPITEKVKKTKKS